MALGAAAEVGEGVDRKGECMNGVLERKRRTCLKNGIRSCLRATERSRKKSRKISNKWYRQHGGHW